MSLDRARGEELNKKRKVAVTALFTALGMGLPGISTPENLWHEPIPWGVLGDESDQIIEVRRNKPTRRARQIGHSNIHKVIRLVVADDLSMIREGIRTMLAPVEDLEIVGEATNGEEAVRLGCELEPDVVLIDQEIPDYDLLEAIRNLKEVMPDVEIIVMANHIDEATALRAIEAGAMGYILKDIPPANLQAALRSVCNDNGFFHPKVTRRLADSLKTLMREQKTLQQLESEGVTKREFDILVELARGSTYSSIANKFVINLSTVKTHVQNIFRKLGCRNRSQVVAYVLRKGLIK